MTDRCPDCKARTGDLQFHQDKQCPIRQMSAEQRELLTRDSRRYRDYFQDRAEGFDDELGRVSKAHRRRVRFHRDASLAAVDALEFKQRVLGLGW